MMKRFFRSAFPSVLILLLFAEGGCDFTPKGTPIGIWKTRTVVDEEMFYTFRPDSTIEIETIGSELTRIQSGRYDIEGQRMRVVLTAFTQIAKSAKTQSSIRDTIEVMFVLPTENQLLLQRRDQSILLERVAKR